MTSLLSQYLNPGVPNNPIVTGANWKPVQRSLPGSTDTYSSPIFSPKPEPIQAPPGYLNPATGKLYSAQEIVDNLAKKLPIGKPPVGDVPGFAGDQMTQGPQTERQIINTATDLNNARNDIATGTTDPYRVNESGVAYSPEQLNAIRSAYAGVYDPALKEVFAKLDEKQKADAKIASDKEWEAKQIFTTNENIRQWKATTGTKSEGDGITTFTDTQENKGASNAGMDIATFKALDSDIKNYFINVPSGTDPTTEKSAPMTKIFSDYMAKIRNGDISPEDVAQLITDSALPEAVKHYYIDNLPLAPEKKDGFFSQIWGMVKGMAGALIQ
jgi:hypothetical protein